MAGIFDGRGFDFNVDEIAGRVGGITERLSSLMPNFRGGGMEAPQFGGAAAAAPQFRQQQQAAMPLFGHEGFAMPSFSGGPNMGPPSFTQNALGLPGFGTGQQPFSWPLNPDGTSKNAPKPTATNASGTSADGWGEGGGGMDWGGSGTAEENGSLTAQKIDQWVASTRPGSPLAGMGDYILKTANSMNISVAHLMGIMLLESGLGTEKGTLPGVYNYGGLTGQGWQGQTGNTVGMARDFATFATKEDGIRALIANLATDAYRTKSLQQQTAYWYTGNPNMPLNATDEKGNATLAQYMDTIASAYRGLGVNTYNPSAPPVQKAPKAGGLGPGAVQRTPDQAIQFGKSFMGVDYTNGGIRSTGDPRSGMDCSSFVGYVYGLNSGLWNAQTQYNTTQRVQKGQLRVGDLVFFADPSVAAGDPSAKPVTHVGIYIGNGQMIHTGQPGVGVTVVSLDQPYYQKYYYGAGRLA